MDFREPEKSLPGGVAHKGVVARTDHESGAPLHGALEGAAAVRMHIPGPRIVFGDDIGQDC